MADPGCAEKPAFFRSIDVYVNVMTGYHLQSAWNAALSLQRRFRVAN
jgi:hypothetical protein